MMLYDNLKAQVKLSLEARMETVFGKAAGPKGASATEHAALVRAIREHDPAAAKNAMRTHLRSIREHLFGLR